MIWGHAQLLLPKLVSTFWLAEIPMQTPAGAGQSQEAEQRGKGSRGAAMGQRCFSACPVSVFALLSFCWEQLPYRRGGRWLKLESGTCWESACLS